MTPAADLYSVGVVLYELLTGRLPFRADTAVSMMLAHQQLSPPPLRQTAPDARIPARLEAIVLAALAKNPAARFPTAHTMERALLDRGDLQPPVERTAPLSNPLEPKQSVAAPVAHHTRHASTRSGPNWLLALLILLAVAGSATVAAWWADADSDSDPDPTRSPRTLEAVPGDEIETDEPDPALTEDDTVPTSADKPQSTNTLVPILPVDTETPVPEGDDIGTPEPRPTETESFELEPTETAEATSTPPSNGNSPPIEPVD